MLLGPKPAIQGRCDVTGCRCLLLAAEVVIVLSGSAYLLVKTLGTGALCASSCMEFVGASFSSCMQDGQGARDTIGCS